MSEKIHLLITDPQNDFCDPHRGALYVQGAEADMARLAHMVQRLKDRIACIHVTLDSHHYAHIAHPVFWKDAAGRHPKPFTIISGSEILRLLPAWQLERLVDTMTDDEEQQ